MLLIVKACACACMCVHIRVRCEMYVGFSVEAYVCVWCACVCMCVSAQVHKATYLPKMEGMGRKTKTTLTIELGAALGIQSIWIQENFSGKRVWRVWSPRKETPLRGTWLDLFIHPWQKAHPHLIARLSCLFTQPGGIFEKRLQTWIFVKIEPK